MTNAMRRIGIRLALHLNKALGRKRGRVYADRYYERSLSTPAEVRNALGYVLCNARKHAWHDSGATYAADWVDGCSSADFFDGWRGRGRAKAPARGDPVRAARTWLLATGWRRRGLIPLDFVPG